MRVIFAGGGTAGHINPAISIADYAKSRDKGFEALFIGTKSGLETKLVPKAGYKLELIEIEGFSRKNMLKNVKVVTELLKSRARMKKLIKKLTSSQYSCALLFV